MRIESVNLQIMTFVTVKANPKMMQTRVTLTNPTTFGSLRSKKTFHLGNAFTQQIQMLEVNA